MTAPLVFMDTETTGLLLSDDIWEFAAIRRDPDGTETEWHMFIEHDRAKCYQLPESFRADHYDRFLDHHAVSKAQAASTIMSIFADGKPHVVGAVPNFDTGRVHLLVEQGHGVKRQNIGWHYHLIDVENLAVGWLNGSANPGQVSDRTAPPWDSNWLSRAVGVEPDDFDRHTAMGDVRWAMAIYDAVMGWSR